MAEADFAQGLVLRTTTFRPPIIPPISEVRISYSEREPRLNLDAIVTLPYFDSGQDHAV